jgi:hypothetical protein
MRWISLLTSIGWQTKAIVMVAFLLGAFAAGWQVHEWKTEASLARSIAQAEKTRSGLITKGEKIVEKLQTQEKEIRYVYKTIYQKIRDANDDRVCFDHESLSLWNQAIAGADRHRENANRTPSPDDTAENQAVIATVEQVLENAAQNFEICHSNAAKHNALIDKVESLQGNMCVCPQ